MKPTLALQRVLLASRNPLNRKTKNIAAAIITLALVQSASATSQTWQGDVSTN